MEYGGYLISGDKVFSMYQIRNTSRGALPKLLKGSYTHVRDAQHAIDRYNGLKEKVNGKSDQRS